jgi:hypothetical protein
LGGIGNNFSGTIPASLSNATKIRELGLAKNSFEGSVLLVEIGPEGGRRHNSLPIALLPLAYLYEHFY